MFFIILGCFLDGISVVVLTTSIIMPMVEQSGIDPLWFGIYLVIVVEMSQITPPVGFNLFVIQGLTGYRHPESCQICATVFSVAVTGSCIDSDVSIDCDIPA